MALDPLNAAVAEGNWDMAAMLKRNEWAAELLTSQVRAERQATNGREEAIKRGEVGNVCWYEAPDGRVIDPLSITPEAILLMVVAPKERLKRRSDEWAYHAITVWQQSHCRGEFPRRNKRHRRSEDFRPTACANDVCSNTFRHTGRGRKHYCSKECAHEVHLAQKAFRRQVERLRAHPLNSPHLKRNRVKA